MFNRLRPDGAGCRAVNISRRRGPRCPKSLPRTVAESQGPALVGEAVVLGRDDLDLEGLFHLSDGALEFDVILVAAIALLHNREALGAEPLFDRIKLSPRFAKARMHLLGREPMIVLL